MEIDELVDELTAALVKMVDRTCPTMRALWLSGSLQARRRAGIARESSIALPPGYAAWSRAKRSKYEALACFRHAVVWQLAPEDWSDASAMGRIYFTPCDDREPFSHSAAPEAKTVDGRRERDAARDDCAKAIEDLRAVGAERTRTAVGPAGQACLELLERAVRATLRDVLKLEDAVYDPTFPRRSER